MKKPFKRKLTVTEMQNVQVVKAVERIADAMEKQTAIMEKYDRIFFPIVEFFSQPDIINTLKEEFKS